MKIKVETLRCNACGICEFACGYHRDREFNAMSSSIMLHRSEKKNYFGVILKREKDLYLARPEGAETLKPGESTGGGASSKPIVMREPCDLCKGEEFVFCVAVCPTGCLQVEEV
jgi:ferredoxin